MTLISSNGSTNKENVTIDLNITEWLSKKIEANIKRDKTYLENSKPKHNIFLYRHRYRGSCYAEDSWNTYFQG